MAVSTGTFADLGLIPELLRALDQEGYTQPTPIQAQAIRPVLEGHDLLGIAQTGTGKTAAFALPILQRLMADKKLPARKSCRALILSPTRELASQIAESFKNYGRFTGLKSGVIFGGVGYKPQINLLERGIDVLVATPGRLIDLMQEGHLSLAATEILVLDEADQMMDLGFIRPLRQIVAKLSHKRQSLFFSATMPHEIGALAAELLRDPIKVSVSPVSKTADRVAQRVIHVEASKKRALLTELVSDTAFSRVLVFTRTKRGADKVARHLEAAGVSAAAIHGNKSQNQREAALDGFKGGDVRVLVATDIAARGIDVDLVTHVINYELPNVPESYVHRIGRTARAGAGGMAISLCDGEEKTYLRDIEKLTRNQIPAEDRRGDATLVATAVSEPREHRDPRARSGAGGRRPDARVNGSRRANGGEGHRDSRGGERGGDDHRRGGHPPRSAGAGARPEAAGGGRPERRPYDPLNAQAPVMRSEALRANGGERPANSSAARRGGGATLSKFDQERASHQSRSGGERDNRGGRGGSATHDRGGASTHDRGGASPQRRPNGGPAGARHSAHGPAGGYRGKGTGGGRSDH